MALIYLWSVRLFGWQPFSDRWSWGYGWRRERRGPTTRIPSPDWTPYTVETERKKLDALLAQ